ncbi:Kae1-associated kinase Bud32 [Metallosphaera tengchongensis]|uniref:non-specific serine/threonine protein kinase n=1 Tax=Metallosphaera tengchongensis TaxID=1532350 RepID=A0A6N0NXI1_9CREN|nr:Kae1-associated kinase Bud32 [Metallosphaera tengchongensis]QKQ99790.1 Kae1-associated kinase Bud32 [Metallosphaera tengchongensis]
MEGGRGRNTLEKLTLLKRGSESLIYRGMFLGIESIFKIRVNKKYRNVELDKKINSERTINEAKLMYSALSVGVNTPAILYVDPDNFEIIMEFLRGPTMKEVLRQYEDLTIFRNVGSMVGTMHNHGIVHGDLTTNNMILHNNQVFLIDFGLAKRSTEIEDLGTDVHVFLRSIESIHPELRDKIFSYFMEGYHNITGLGEEIEEKVNEIRMRGRYVDERRNKNRN